MKTIVSDPMVLVNTATRTLISLEADKYPARLPACGSKAIPQYATHDDASMVEGIAWRLDTLSGMFL